jgi:hypothetical protein
MMQLINRLNLILMAVVCVMLFMALCPVPVKAQNSSAAPKDDWICGDPNVIAVRHWVEKEDTRDWWEIFAVQVGATVGPRRIVLHFDTKTEKLTLNGKRCQTGQIGHRQLYAPR